MFTGDRLYMWLSEAMREWQFKYGLLRPSNISWERSWNTLGADWQYGFISLANKINSVTSELSQAAIEDVVRCAESSHRPKGSVLTVEFTLAGQEFMALNGGPHFTFSAAISLFVKCADQAEVDRFWTTLSDGGAPGQCGWLTDRFGVSWQIVPMVLGDMLKDPDPARTERVTQALMQMTKLNIDALKEAYDAELAA